MAKILMVEDDIELAATVAKYLTLERYLVETVRDGQEGLERVLGGAYDAIVLDIQLPNVSGIEICKQYRQKRGKTPIIMLTGLGSVAHKENGLDSGADDYLTKPFSVRELSARLRVMLRRQSDVPDDKIEIGKLVLSLSAHTIFLNGTPLKLNPTDFALLEFLMRHQGEIFNADALISRVWSTDAAPGNDAVRSAIRRIRQTIDTGGQPSLIENVNKVGYRMGQPR